MPRVRPTWPSPSPGRAAAALLAAATLACGRGDERSNEGPPLPATVPEGVAEHLAQRDGLDLPAARARAEDTLRLARAAREGGAQGLSPARRDHLLRTARARLWLRERFEPDHGPADIPADDPLLVAAARSYEISRPHPVVIMCQLLLVPPEGAPEGQAEDPAWRAKGLELMAPIARGVRPLIPPGTKDACPTLRALTPHLEADPSPDHRLRFEMAGLDLGRCLDDEEEGEPRQGGPKRPPGAPCDEPMLDPTWESEVRAAKVPGFIDPFATPFGIHLVYVHERLPANDPDSPKVQAKLRASVLDDYRRRELDRVLARLRRERIVRLAEGAGATP